MVENAWEEVEDNLHFVENSNFIRGSTEADIRNCSGVNSQKNTHGGVHGGVILLHFWTGPTGTITLVIIFCNFTIF